MGQTIDTLTTRLEADISNFEEKMKKAVAIMDDAGDRIIRKHAAVEASAGLMGEGIGKAFDRVFDRSRLAVLEEGGAKIGVFGSALEALGPAGIAAGAALAAFAIGGEEAKKAMEWAEELEVTANKLGITTTQLQELNYTASKSGVATDVLKDGLQKVGQAIGAFTSNVKDARVNAIFDALGISKSDARAWQTPVEGLEAIADRLATIHDRSQQLALAKNLKVPDDMVPLLLQGGDAIREMMDEARSSGAVMDHEMVEKAAEMARKMKEANVIIGTQLRTAFLELAPAVEAIARLMATIATKAADAAEAIKGARIGQTPDYDVYSIGHLQRAALDQQNELKSARSFLEDNYRRTHVPGESAQLFDSVGHLTAAGRNVDPGGRYQRAIDAYEAIGNAYTKKLAEEKEALAAVTSKGSSALAPEKGKTRTDQTASFDATVATAYDQAEKAAASAQAKLASSLEDRLICELQIAEAEKNAKINELTKKEGEILASKNDAHKAEQIAVLEKAKTEVLNAEKAQGELAARTYIVDKIKEAEAVAAQEAKLREATLQREQDHFTALAAIADTLADRTKYERAALTLQQKRDDDQAAAEVQRTLAELAVATALKDQAKIIAAQNDLSEALSRQQNLSIAHADQNAAFDKQHGGPLADYFNGLKDVNTELQNVAVRGLGSLEDGLVGVATHTKTLGQAFHEMANGIIADIARIVIEQDFIKPLANDLAHSGFAAGFSHFLGFASGTDDAPGGLAMVGEAGPELVALPRGAQVLPNNLLRNAVGAPQGGGVSQVVQITNHVYANNSLVRAELDQQMLMFTAQGMDLAQKRMLSTLAKNTRQRLI